MPNNFRNLTLTTYPSATNFYVNMNGSNLTGDGSPDNPYKSIQYAIDAVGSNDLVLGCGTYSTVWISITERIRGEVGLAKYTVLDLLGGTSYNYTDISDVTIKNGTLLCSPSKTIGISTSQKFTRCIFIDMIISSISNAIYGGVDYEFIDCEFINCVFPIGFNDLKTYFERCKIINTIVGNFGCKDMKSTDIDEFSEIKFANTPLTVKNNNFRGNLFMPTGVSAGIPIDLTTAQTNYPATFDDTNFSADPLYNDVSKMSLTVQTGSPNLGTGQFGSNIGNVYRALALFNDITPIMTVVGGATIVGLIGTQDLTVNPVLDDGFLITGTIVVNSSQVEYVNEINYLGKIATDSSFGGSSNSQVPDVLDYAIGTKGDNPPRLKFFARWHTGNTPPSPLIGAEWDNGGFVGAGLWSLFCFGEKPYLDSTFKGNGHQDFDDTDPSKFQVGAKWFQIWCALDKENWNVV